MKQEELISIIVPVYNVADYINNCVKSIFTQTYGNFEVILIDDGSTDKSGIYCDELAKSDERIRVIHQANGGLSVARNTGLELARGEWISFIDSDDSIHPDMLKNLVKSAVDNNCMVALCGIIYQDELYNTIKTYLPTPQVLEGEALQRYFYEEGKGKEYMCNKLFHRSLFKSIRFPKDIIYEDTFVLPQILQLAKRAVFTDQACYYYLQRSSGLSFNLNMEKQFDGLTARQYKRSFMQQHYPTLVPLAGQEILEACCWLLYKTYQVKGKDFKENKQRILTVFHREKKTAAKQGLLIKTAVIFITVSPSFYVWLYGLYCRVKHCYQGKRV